MIKTKNIFRSSSRKFFELVQEEGIQVMPEIPQDAVLSKYLTQLQSKQSLSQWQKPKTDKLNYSQLLNGSPYGSIQSFTHRGHQLTLISTNYLRMDEKKLHKVLYMTKPDAIVVQRRPDYHVKEFELLIKGDDGVFSDRRYLEQLRYKKEEEPGLQNWRPIVNALNKNKDSTLEPNPNKEILPEKAFQTCLLYTKSYSTPLYLSQSPLRSYRQHLANTHTLMQLQQIFKVVCQRLPRYGHLSFTPYHMATLIYPEIFMKVGDLYQATVMEMMIGSGRFKRIVGVFGIVQNQAIRYMLERDEALNPIIQLLVPSGPKGTIVRDIEPLQIVQKQILLDVMFFGSEVENIKTQQFHVTNAVIEKYAKETDKKTMMKFRYDKIIEYLGLMRDKIKQGQEEIQKEFVRETLRDRKK